MSEPNDPKDSIDDYPGFEDREGEPVEDSDPERFSRIDDGDTDPYGEYPDVMGPGLRGRSH